MREKKGELILNKPWNNRRGEAIHCSEMDNYPPKSTLSFFYGSRIELGWQVTKK